MLRWIVLILLTVGMAGCSLLAWTPDREAPASGKSATSFPTRSAAPLEVELPGHLQHGQALEETRKLVLDAYSHVPLEPILRIETQAHLRAIHALAVNLTGKIIATASVDRTIRFWDIEQGTLRATLRVPSGRRGAGTPYALAYSPDGRTLATAGLSFFSKPTDQLRQATFLIHFFDTEQNVINRTLEGIPGRVHHLAYSRNGRYLAVAYGADNVPELGPQRIVGGSGVRIYDAKNLTLLRETTTESPCQWVEFDNGQQLYALCQRVILQYTGLQLNRMRESDGAPFHHAALSPDARTLAVSYRDALRIDLLDTTDLALRHTLAANTPGASASDFDNLLPVWSQGGSYLYAAGRRANAQLTGNRLFKWPADGEGLPATFELDPLDVLAMIPGRDGQIYLGTSAATVLTLNNQTGISMAVGNATIDSDNRPGELRVSADGRTVAYSDDLAGRRRYVFSLDRRTLLPWDGAMHTSELRGAITEAKPDVRNWRLSHTLSCDGKPLDLGGAVAQNLAIDPRGRGFVIGTETSVIHFDAQCQRRWETPNQARSIAVAIADAAGLVLSQDEAGVIRWLRLADGEKLLSFFPSLNGRSWTTWTPLGHYDASPEGEALVGWHVNRDRHREALFYGAGRFRDLFHNPDEITRSLNRSDQLTRDAEIGRALALGQTMRERLPPQVHITQIREKTDKKGLLAQIVFRLRVPTGETTTRVRALVNGRPAGAAQVITLDEGAEEATAEMLIPLPADAVELALIAETGGRAGEPARIQLHESLAEGATSPTGARPRLYALVVGIAKYRSNKVPVLDFPGKDAQDFARMLKTQSGSLYQDVEVRLLADDQATRERIIDGMDWLRREVTANDVAVVFLAGHGVNDNLSQYFYLPHDADIERLRSTAISNNDIVEILQSLPSKVLAFLDTCHSGNVLGTGKKRALGDINRLVNELTSAENGVVVFASSTGQETSLESPDWNNGAFTKALVEGLNGRGDFNRDGVISLNELNLWVADRVKNLSRGEQHANMIRPDSIRDFPFALIRQH
jgi:WD40 repeat protein